MENKVYNAQTEKYKIVKQAYEIQIETMIRQIELEIECLTNEVDEMKENGQDTRSMKGKIQGLKRSLKTIQEVHKVVEI